MNNNTNPPVVQRRDPQEDTIDLLDLLMYYRERLIFIIIAFVIGAVAAGCYTKFMVTPMYTANAKMYMVSASSNSAIDLTDLNIGTNLSKDYQELLKIHAVYDHVIDDLELDMTYNQLASMVTIGAISDTRILKISVTGPDPEQAADIANAIVIQGQKLLPKLMDTPTPTIAEEALVPKKPSSPSYSKNIMMGALLVTMLLLGIYTLRYLMDDTIKTAEDIEKYFGVMPLAVVPEGDLPTISDKVESGKRRKRKKKKKGGDVYYG